MGISTHIQKPLEEKLKNEPACIYIRSASFKNMFYRSMATAILLLLSFGSEAQNQSDALKGTFLHERNVPVYSYPGAWLNWSTDTQMVAALRKEILAEGQRLQRSGKYEDALRYYQQALRSSKPFSHFRVNLYNSIANLYHNAGNYEEAIQTYYSALKHAGDKVGRAKLYINISSLYTDLKDYDKAMQSLDEAIHILEQNGGGTWMAVALLNKGNIYSERGMHDNALLEFRKAYTTLESPAVRRDMERGQASDVDDMRTVIINNIADAYLKSGYADSALYCLQQALPDFDALSQYSKCLLLITLGEVFSHQGNYQSALKYLEEGLAISEQSGYPLINKEAYRLLAVVEAHLGDYKAAWEYQRSYTQLNDSLITIEHVNKINKLERQQEMSVRDKELARKELLITEQAGHIKEKNLQAVILIAAVMLLIGMALFFRKNYKNKQHLLGEQLSNAMKDKRIMQIEAGIKGEEKERTRIARDLHDGVASEMLVMKLNLQAMERDHQSLKHSDDFRNIIAQAEEVTDKLRQAAHNLMPDNLQEQGLIEAVQAFISRVDNHKLQFSFLYYGTVPALREATGKIILMITLELIQNILKHARATEALVQFNFFEDNLSITVEDNGIGIGNDYGGKKGMGLANIEANVVALSGSMDIKSSEYTGTTTLIEIPLDEHTLTLQKVGTA